MAQAEVQVIQVITAEQEILHQFHHHKEILVVIIHLTIVVQVEAVLVQQA